MNPTFPNPTLRPLPRRRVLAAAILAALVVAAVLPGVAHRAPRSDRLLPPVVIVADAEAADAPGVPKAPPPPPAPAAIPAPPPAPAPGSAAVAPSAPADTAAKSAEAPLKSGAEITIDDKGIRIEKPGTEGKRSRKITIRGDVDGDFDGLGSSGNPPRWVAPLAFLAVSLFFLVPLAAVALVIWYKMRRTRMLNETLLKYAEKGIAPPPEALSALGGSAAVAAMEATPASSPIYEQAKAVRRRAAWSDLRKGVVMGTIGLGLTLFSMFDDGSPNAIGLVLLFVGVGYGVLWYLEERQGRGMPRDLPSGGA
jgi:hypothetical protein